MSKPNFKKGDKIQSTVIKEMGNFVTCEVISEPTATEWDSEEQWEMQVTDGIHDMDVFCDFCWIA